MARYTRKKQRGGVACTALRHTTPKRGANNVEQSCIEKAARTRRNTELGCGEQGCTYTLVNSADKVIKITPFWSGNEKPEANDMKEASEKWYAEACMGEYLGELDGVVAPRIHQFFECDDRGYIIMDKISVAEKFYIRKGRAEPQLVVIREKGEGAATDHINLMPAEMQYGFVKKLSIMIDNGVIHMDNHIGNLGFIFGNTSEPLVFDFGFTVERQWSNEADKSWALAFSLFQIIEHCPLNEVEETHIYRLATAIMKGTYEINDGNMARAVGYTLEQLTAAYPEGNDLAAVKAAAKKKSGARNPNMDIYIGCVCYATIIGLEKEARYEHPLYEIIYQIRKSEPIE